MSSQEPVAYTYEADTHCPECTAKRFGKVWRVLNHTGKTPKEAQKYRLFSSFEAAEEYSKGRYMVYGPFIAEGARDDEGNEVGAIFPWDEWENSLVCGTCHEEIA